MERTWKLLVSQDKGYPLGGPYSKEESIGVDIGVLYFWKLLEQDLRLADPEFRGEALCFFWGGWGFGVGNSCCVISSRGLEILRLCEFFCESTIFV